MKTCSAPPRNFTATAFHRPGTQMVESFFSLEMQKQGILTLRKHVVDVFAAMAILRGIDANYCRKDELNTAMYRFSQGKKPITMSVGGRLTDLVYHDGQVPVITYEVDIDLETRKHALTSVTRDFVTKPTYRNTIDCDIGVVRQDKNCLLLRKLGDLFRKDMEEVIYGFDYTKTLMSKLEQLFSGAIHRYAEEKAINLLVSEGSAEQQAHWLPVSFMHPMKMPDSFFNHSMMLTYAGYEGVFNRIADYREDFEKFQASFAAKGQGIERIIPAQSSREQEAGRIKLQDVLANDPAFAQESSLFQRDRYTSLRLCQELPDALEGVNSLKIATIIRGGKDVSYMGQAIILMNDGSVLATEVMQINVSKEHLAKKVVAIRFWERFIHDKNFAEPYWTEHKLVTDMVSHVGMPPKYPMPVTERW